MTGPHLTRADLSGANLTGARAWGTIFGALDLGRAKGLDALVHRGPWTLGVDTLYRSGGSIPEVFLRGVGLPDIVITFARSLVGRPNQF
ncbi:MAG: pentapeptide repeat-containing protein [Chloroflexota bacterium]|nr:pentapeptide repeat-containing protein [Chloroflexota bacterium]